MEGGSHIGEIIFCNDFYRPVVEEGSEEIREWTRDKTDIAIESEGLRFFVHSGLIDEVDLPSHDNDIIHLEIDDFPSIVAYEEYLEKRKSNIEKRKGSKWLLRHIDIVKYMNTEEKNSDKITSRYLVEKMIKDPILELHNGFYGSIFFLVRKLIQFSMDFLIEPEKSDTRNEYSNGIENQDSRCNPEKNKTTLVYSSFEVQFK